MNSFPVQQQYPQLQQQQQQQQQAASIDPSLLAFRNQGQPGGPSANGNKFPYGGGMGGGGFNPQLMSSQGGGGTLNPTHLMNGTNHHQQTVNPQQMFQQQQQQHQQQQQQQQQHGLMNGAMGINPSALNSSHLPNTQHPLAGLSREQMQLHFNSMSPQQQQLLQAKMAANAQAALNQQQQQQHVQQQQQQQQQFQPQSHSHAGLQQQQQNSAVQQQALQQILAQQQQQHQQGAYYGDRPSSSASSHQQMMPPPVNMPPRPPTAGPGPSSRPGTSHSHGNGPQVGLPGAQMQMQRPPSRPTTAGGFDSQQLQQHQFPMTNGYSGANQPKPANIQQPHFNQQMQASSSLQQQQQQQFQQQQQHHQPQHSPPPGSPYRGAKRKVANGMDSPRMGNLSLMGSQMGGGMGMGMGGGMMGASMGPPGISRQISNSSIDQQQGQQQQPFQQNHPAMMNGYSQPSQTQQQQQHPSSQPLANTGMRPQSSNGHIPSSPHTPTHNGGMSALMNDASRMSSMGSLSGGMNISSMGMNLGMNSVDTPPRTPQRNPPAQISGFPAVGSPMPAQQQQHRQPSTPTFSPLASSLQQSMMPPHGAKPSLDPATNIGLKMGGLPPLGTGGFSGLEARTAGMPSRLPSVAPAQHPLNSSLPAVKQPPPAPGIQPVLPPLPANVQLNPQVTRVTVVPLAGSDVAIPTLSPTEIEKIQTWREADKNYEGIWRKMKERMSDEIRTVTGPSKAGWWEKDAVDLTRRRPREQFDVRYPRQKRDRERRKTGRREGLRLPRKLSTEDANRPEQLVPIRLEFDVEHHKMRDSFVWNLNDPVVTPEAFAQSVVEDYALSSSYHAVITKSIQDQLSDFRIHSTNPDGDVEEAEVDIMQGELDEEDAAWWESWRKRLRTERGSLKSARRAAGKNRKRKRVVKDEPSATKLPAGGLVPVDVDDIEVDESMMHEDMRILIKLDIVVGSMKLEDQFEWDLDNVNASPEQFAEVYGADLGLTGEYKTAIAHSIREQVQMYQKSLFLVGHPADGSPIQDEDLRMSFLPSLSSGARSIDQVGSFTPLLNYLSDGDIERNEKEREKEINKRRKRNTRGRRGIAMPDREPIRTHRTPAIGFPELDPSTLAAAVAASAPTSRRAAAAAASLTIANMVASENGTLHMPQTTPMVSQPPPSTSKEKKPKGLFKAPSYPPSVLRPRARVSAPTPSTAAESSSLSLPVDPDAPASTRGATADSRASRVITAKRAKELEREAKEKEYADGQHANMIDGVWHCSNCGCPEDIAVGRRKGPLGDKSQCGTCGKYWHRHRRPMAVEYNSSAEYHTNKIREAELARTVARRRGGAAALRAQNAGAATPGDDGEAASSPQNEGESEPPQEQPQQPAIPPSEDDRAASPASSTSSDSEPPLAQRVSKVNGSNHAGSVPPAPASSSSAPATQSSPPTSHSVPPAVGASAPPSTVTPTDPPKWLWSTTQSMRSKYPDDLFVLKRVNGTDWRIKCSDCPGKLYTPGPGETLSNYEVHLKNRQHRQRVNERVSGGAQLS